MTDPLFCWSPPRRRSDGDLACELAESTRLRGKPVVLDVQQRAELEDIFAEGDRPGVPAAFAAVIVGQRQCTGKTVTLSAAALADLFIFDCWLHIWTAHLVRTSTGAFRDMRSMIASNGDLKALTKWPPNTANGQQAIELLSGQRLEFHARSTGAGRGLAGDRNTADEGLFLTAEDMGALLPTMATIPHAQLRIGSSAGLGGSAVLRGYRDRGRAGVDPRLAYREFAVPLTECVNAFCEHLDLDDAGCALNDRELWRRWIPMQRMPEDRLLDFRKNMPPGEFAREFYGWWDEPDEAQHPIDAGEWKRAGIDGLSPDAQQVLEPVAVSVECNLDRTITTVGVAGLRPDGKAQVELAKRGQGYTWLVPYVLERVEKRRPVAVVVDPAGPAGFLIEKLRRAGVEVLEPTARVVAQGCQDFGATVNEGKVTDPETGEVRTSELVHTRDVVLTSAVHAVEAKPTGAWVRENDKADVSALYAATLAFVGLQAGGGRNVFIPSRRESILVVGPKAAQWAEANAPGAQTAEHMPAWERDKFRKQHAARVVVVLDDYTDFRPSKYGREELVTIGG